MRALPLLFLLLLLSGCLEAPAPPSAELGLTPPTLEELIPTPPVPQPPTRTTPAPLPTPSPTPSPKPEPQPEAESVVLHRNKRPTGDRDIVEVPRDAMLVELLVEANESWAGDVRLLRPDGSVAATCREPQCLRRVMGEPGIWNVAWDASVPPEVAATVTAILYPPGTPTVGAHNAYSARPAWAGTLNRTDFFSVLPGHAELRGAFLLDVVDDADSRPPRIVLQGPRFEQVLVCGVSECPIQVGQPSPGVWSVRYEGSGNGTGYANLTLLGEAYRPVTWVAYDGDHHYRSHVARGDFGEGFTVPAEYERLGYRIRFFAVLPEGDASTTARVELRGPGVPEGTGCSRAQEECEAFLPSADPGMYEVWYLGADATSAVEVLVKLA